MFKVSLPSSLIQKIQYDYIDKKYREGVYVFKQLNTDTIEIIICGLVSWMEEYSKLNDSMLCDLSFLLEKK